MTYTVAYTNYVVAESNLKHFETGKSLAELHKSPEWPVLLKACADTERAVIDAFAEDEMRCSWPSDVIELMAYLGYYDN